MYSIRNFCVAATILAVVMLTGCDNGPVETNVPVPPTSDVIVYLTDKDFDDTIKEGIVLVDFYADWCGPCKMMEPHIVTAAEKFKGRVLVAKVDVDVNKKLWQRFASQGIPTLVLFEDGQPVRSVVGYITEDRVIGLIENILRKREDRATETENESP